MNKYIAGLGMAGALSGATLALEQSPAFGWETDQNGRTVCLPNEANGDVLATVNFRNSEPTDSGRNMRVVGHIGERVLFVWDNVAPVGKNGKFVNQELKMGAAPQEVTKVDLDLEWVDKQAFGVDKDYREVVLAKTNPCPKPKTTTSTTTTTTRPVETVPPTIVTTTLPPQTTLPEAPVATPTPVTELAFTGTAETRNRVIASGVLVAMGSALLALSRRRFKNAENI